MADASGMGLGVTLSPELLDQIQMVSAGFLNLNTIMQASEQAFERANALINLDLDDLQKFIHSIRDMTQIMDKLLPNLKGIQAVSSKKGDDDADNDATSDDAGGDNGTGSGSLPSGIPTSVDSLAKEAVSIAEKSQQLKNNMLNGGFSPAQYQQAVHYANQIRIQVPNSDNYGNLNEILALKSVFGSPALAMAALPGLLKAGLLADDSPGKDPQEMYKIAMTIASGAVSIPEIYNPKTHILNTDLLNQFANNVADISLMTDGKTGPTQFLKMIKDYKPALLNQLADPAKFASLAPVILAMHGNNVDTTVQALGQDFQSAVTNSKDIAAFKKIGVPPGGALYKNNPMAWLETVLIPALDKNGDASPTKQKKFFTSQLGWTKGLNGLLTHLGQVEADEASYQKTSTLPQNTFSYISQNNLAVQLNTIAAAVEAFIQALDNVSVPKAVKALNSLTGMINGIDNIVTNHPVVATMIVDTMFASFIGSVIGKAVTAVVGGYVFGRVVYKGGAKAVNWAKGLEKKFFKTQAAAANAAAGTNGTTAIKAGTSSTSPANGAQPANASSGGNSAGQQGQSLGQKPGASSGAGTSQKPNSSSGKEPTQDQSGENQTTHSNDRTQKAADEAKGKLETNLQAANHATGDGHEKTIKGDENPPQEDTEHHKTEEPHNTPPPKDEERRGLNDKLNAGKKAVGNGNEAPTTDPQAGRGIDERTSAPHKVLNEMKVNDEAGRNVPKKSVKSADNLIESVENHTKEDEKKLVKVLDRRVEKDFRKTAEKEVISVAEDAAGKAVEDVGTVVEKKTFWTVAADAAKGVGKLLLKQSAGAIAGEIALGAAPETFGMSLVAAGAVTAAVAAYENRGTIENFFLGPQRTPSPASDRFRPYDGYAPNNASGVSTSSGQAASAAASAPATPTVQPYVPPPITLHIPTPLPVTITNPDKIYEGAAMAFTREMEGVQYGITGFNGSVSLAHPASA